MVTTMSDAMGLLATGVVAMRGPVWATGWTGWQPARRARG
jgi:hypothetical protein